MALEYAFFAAQSQGTAEEYGPIREAHGDTAGGRGNGSSCQAGVEHAGDRERLSGVHHRVALLCVDFDDTLTDGDTTSLLVKTAQAQVRLGEVTVALLAGCYIALLCFWLLARR